MPHVLHPFGCALCLVFTTPILAPGLGLAKETALDRIVFLGDSITDGHTYPLWLCQALQGAGRPVPVCINAGIGGDTAKGMRLRIDRDVLVHRPTLVSLSVGINDILHGVKPEAYEADVTAIADQLRVKQIAMLILTTTILGPRHTEADMKLAAYNQFLRRLARERGYRLGEINEPLRHARSAGADLLEKDQVHLNQEGYRVMTRAILDGLDFKEVSLPATLNPEPMPGIIHAWHMRAVTPPAPHLDDNQMRGLKIDGSWKIYSLPEETPLKDWWPDQERRRGFAMSLDKSLGAGRSYQGMASVDSARSRRVYFNTGAQLQTIWLNGKRIYRGEGWTGWHAGKERIAADLIAGRNWIIIETAGPFFLSITATNTW